MDLKISSAQLYGALPKTVSDKKGPLRLKDPKADDGVTFLSSFLKRQVPKKRHKELDNEKELRFKRVAIVNTQKKEVKDFIHKRKTLSAREKRDLKLFDIKPEAQKYEMYVPLHELWRDYMKDLINFKKITKKNQPEAEKKLLKADYHGAIITVTKAKCTPLIGLTGIVLIETKHTFKIITEENKLKTVPKKNVEFSIELEGYRFTIYGNNFMHKAADRSTRKFKATSIDFT